MCCKFFPRCILINGISLEIHIFIKCGGYSGFNGGEPLQLNFKKRYCCRMLYSIHLSCFGCCILENVHKLQIFNSVTDIPKTAI